MDDFRVYTDTQGFADQWFLGEPVAEDGSQLDARDFRYGKPYVGPLPGNLPIGAPGRPAAFHLGAFDMPVLSDEAVETLRRICPADFEAFPVTAGASLRGYQIVNAVHREACVDEQRSTITWWKPDDHRQDRIGTYRTIDKLVLDAKATDARGRHLFRIRNFEIALMASERVRRALPDLGGVFEPVT